MPIDDDKLGEVMNELSELKTLLVTKKGESMIDILESIRDMLYKNPFISNGMVGVVESEDDSGEEGDDDESDGDFEIKEIEENVY
jgi:hypothetical protein